MVPWNNFAIDLAIMTIYFTAFVLITIRWNPRIWLHDFPADIQALAAPKTPHERHLTRVMAVPLVVSFLGLPILLSWDLKTLLGSNFSFGIAWLYTYGLFFGVNMWDLVVLDWVGISLIDPQNPPFAGTEGAAGWRDYAFHFYGFLKGCVMCLIFALFGAGLITLFA